MSFEVKITPEKRQQKSHPIERLCEILRNGHASIVRKSQLPGFICFADYAAA